MSGEEIAVCSWRIVEGKPFGLMMWFDPTCEEPRLVRSSWAGEHPPDSEESSSALRAQKELFEGGRVGPLEGGDADDDSLPF